MAETWTYGVYWNESQNYQLPDKESVSVTIRRLDNTGKDGSLYKIVSGSTISSNVNIKTWSTGGLSIGSYGTTGTLAADSSAHTFTDVSFSPSSSILGVGSSSTTTYLTRTSGSSQTIFIYGTSASPCFTISVKVDTKYTASTISGGNTNFGSNSSVTISNSSGYGSELTHQVKWTLSGNNITHTSGYVSKSGTGSVSYAIPSSWMDTVPSGTSISCSLEIKTYKGSTQIGSTNTGTCTFTVPASVKPTVSSITCSIKDENQGIPNTYIQNTTGVYIQINNASPGYGASITDYNISANVTETYAFDQSNTRYVVNKLTNSGEITFSLSVKDSRGRQSSVVTAKINVMEYALPSITVISAYRCRSSGIADDEGTYACIRIVAEYSQTGGNTMTINSTYYRSDIPSQQYTAQSNMESGVSYIVGNNQLSPSYAYFVRFTVTDSLGNVITRDVRVQTSSFAIHVKNGGTGVAVGKTSEVANSFEINEGWDMYYKGVVVLPVVYSETNAPSSPFEGLVWLKKKT